MQQEKKNSVIFRLSSEEAFSLEKQDDEIIPPSSHG